MARLVGLLTTVVGACRGFVAAPTTTTTGPKRRGMTTAMTQGQHTSEAFAAVVNARYRCPKFDPTRPIDETTLRTIFDLTRRAPTSFNTQPWKAVVVRGDAAKVKLAAAMPGGNKAKVETAPVSVVFAADTQPDLLFTDETPEYIKDMLPVFVGQCSTPEAWAFKQTGIVASHFMLACAAHGVDTCAMEGFTSINDVKAAVGLEGDRYSIPVVVSVGYAADPRAATSPRYPLDTLFCLDDAASPFPF